jgi:hypothetical protein
MNDLKVHKGFAGLSIVSAATSLPAASATNGIEVADVQSIWNAGASVPSEFDLELSAAGAVDLTDLELQGYVQNQTQIASDDMDTVTAGTDTITAASHGLAKGDGPIQLTTTDTLPAGLTLTTDYWIIYVDADNFKLAASLEDAIEGTAIDITDAGTGTHSFEGSESGDYMSGSNNAFEVEALSYGLLGPAADGAVSLTALKGYATRIGHRPRTVLYALEGTLSAAVALRADLYPVQEAR